MSIRIVVADAHAMLRDAFKVLLEKHGFEVVGTAGNGCEAVEMTRSKRPQIVVMDLFIPSMEAALRIRNESGVPVILITRNSEDQQVVDALNTGVAGCVVKARAGSDLVPAIREVLRGAGAPQEWFRTDVITLGDGRPNEEHRTQVNVLFRFCVSG
jgi:DNA-binding NarL/FixJ family response regulator